MTQTVSISYVFYYPIDVLLSFKQLCMCIIHVLKWKYVTYKIYSTVNEAQSVQVQIPYSGTLRGRLY